MTRYEPLYFFYNVYRRALRDYQKSIQRETNWNILLLWWHSLQRYCMMHNKLLQVTWDDYVKNGKDWILIIRNHGARVSWRWELSYLFVSCLYLFSLQLSFYQKRSEINSFHSFYNLSSLAPPNSKCHFSIS